MKDFYVRVGRVCGVVATINKNNVLKDILKFWIRRED